MIRRVGPILLGTATLTLTLALAGSLLAGSHSPNLGVRSPPTATPSPIQTLPEPIAPGVGGSIDGCVNPPRTALASDPPSTTRVPSASTAPPSAPTPDQRFWNAVCERRAVTADLEQLLRFPPPEPAVTEQFRAGMCAPGFEPPNRLSVAVGYRLRIRGQARNDPALGELWLDEGILTVFEYQQLSDGTVLFDIDYNMDRLNVLIDADLEFFDWFTEHRGAVCADFPPPTTVA